MRKFKNEIGLTIKEYIVNQKRIDLFFSILMNISANLYKCSQSHFTHQF